MKITTITVRYGRTYHLSNDDLGNEDTVNVEVEVTADLEDKHDHAHNAIHSLFATAQPWVEEKIDEALEERGVPAHFSADPRYDLWQSQRKENVLAIVPKGTAHLEGWRRAAPWGHAIIIGQRKHALRRIIAADPDLQERNLVIDCADGNLSPLTTLNRLWMEEEATALNSPPQSSEE
ncbi:MAG: hypothetical protein EI684_21215 [Candidatus Viridilinea halotolerans]|uniref:Uncharacterized protein n=1 Tax=Candidatus Viridilinea halotolerans TaxID=2491704 RepID=A0A426TRM1_9CHLR|nr:MAG: hypothetical protein EI684_21215 [Candidatus Viridilinea halotolerans]